MNILPPVVDDTSRKERSWDVPLSFENTEIAFQARDDKSLRRSYWLFRMIQFPSLVQAGTLLARVALWLRIPIEPLLKITFFRQFCGGETIEGCQETIRALGKFRVGSILDYSVEGANNEKTFDGTTEEILKTIGLATMQPLVPFCVFKVTGVARAELLEKIQAGELLTFAEMGEWQRARERIFRLCNRAHENNVSLFIDAEESWIQETIDRTVEEMMALFNKRRALIFTTIQMYRTDRTAYLEKALARAKIGKYFFGIKLVRGAYMEKERARAAKKGKPSPIHPTKEATDQAFDGAVTYLLSELPNVAFCAGTHNQISTQRLTEQLEALNIEKSDSRIYFAQLYGMGDHLSFALADEGFNVAKYMPYGPVREVFPYLVRRAQENTAIAGQSSRELQLLEAERQRRNALRLIASPRVQS